MQAVLRKSLIVSVLALGVAVIGGNASADPGDNLHWKSVIGIAQRPAMWLAVVPQRPQARRDPGRRRAAASASISDKGKFDFDVRGLVLAAGNSIGTPGTVVQVKGTLVCDTNGSAGGGNSVLVDTPLVDLDEDGDAQLPRQCRRTADGVHERARRRVSDSDQLGHSGSATARSCASSSG